MWQRIRPECQFKAAHDAPQPNETVSMSRMPENVCEQRRIEFASAHSRRCSSICVRCLWFGLHNVQLNGRTNPRTQAKHFSMLAAGRCSLVRANPLIFYTENSIFVRQTKHRRIHTGERRYACDYCPLRFTALSTMKNHRRIHTGERPYQCQYCSRSFCQRSDCVSHTRIHTGKCSKTPI